MHVRRQCFEGSSQEPMEELETSNLQQARPGVQTEGSRGAWLTPTTLIEWLGDCAKHRETRA